MPLHAFWQWQRLVREVLCPAAGLKAEQLLSMIQAKGSGYAMSTEEELESIRQVALQTGGLGPLPGPAQGRGGVCCTVLHCTW